VRKCGAFSSTRKLVEENFLQSPPWLFFFLEKKNLTAGELRLLPRIFARKIFSRPKFIAAQSHPYGWEGLNSASARAETTVFRSMFRFTTIKQNINDQKYKKLFLFCIWSYAKLMCRLLRLTRSKLGHTFKLLSSIRMRLCNDNFWTQQKLLREKSWLQAESWAARNHFFHNGKKVSLWRLQ
jgi:hypothetical protein